MRANESLFIQHPEIKLGVLGVVLTIVLLFFYMKHPNIVCFKLLSMLLSQIKYMYILTFGLK